MSVSLCLTWEQKEAYLRGTDNLYLAFEMDKYGKPLPPETSFYRSYPVSAISDTIFFKALTLLFPKSIYCIEGDDEDVYEEGCSVKHCIREIQHWHKLKEKAPVKFQGLMRKDEEKLMKTLISLNCDYSDLGVEATMKSYGLHLIIQGSEWGLYSSFFTSFLIFYDQLKELIYKWKPIIAMEEREYERRKRTKNFLTNGQRREIRYGTGS